MFVIKDWKFNLWLFPIFLTALSLKNTNLSLKLSRLLNVWSTLVIRKEVAASMLSLISAYLLKLLMKLKIVFLKMSALPSKSAWLKVRTNFILPVLLKLL